MPLGSAPPSYMSMVNARQTMSGYWRSFWLLRSMVDMKILYPSAMRCFSLCVSYVSSARY